MKTTVEIDDGLLIAAKKLAIERRTTLRAIVERGLRAELDRSPVSTAEPRSRRIRWVTVQGGLPPGLDMASREALYDWLERNR